jgi:hypothetical protein
MRRALAITGAAVLLITGIQLSVQRQRISDTNDADPVAFLHDAISGNGTTVCQNAELVPDDAAAVRIFVGTYQRPGARIDVRASIAGNVIARGALLPGWPQGAVTIPIRRVAPGNAGAHVCFRFGHGPRTRIIGTKGAAPFTEFDGRGAGGRMRIVYLRAGEESLAGLAVDGVIARRYGYGAPDLLGGWTVWLIALLLVGSLGVAGCALWRTERL